MTLLDWVAVAVIVGGLVFLRRRIVALGRRASAAARKRPVLWSVPLVLLGLLVAWKGPEWQLASRAASLPPDRYLELQNSYRATIVQALGGLFLLLGLYLTWRRVTATEQQVVIAGEGQITERFTRAIEQLGSEKLAVRLGGIYALERIARDSERDHWPIMEVLTGYVRENAPRSEDGEGEDLPSWPATDIQAVLTVLRRRRVDFETDRNQRLDLRVTNLNSADLSRARLSTARASGSGLDGPDLFMAALPFADLSKAHLRGADLYDANLTGADLGGADLSGAQLASGSLTMAKLSGADLSGADLLGTDLSGVDLSEAKGLTREQIKSAVTDEHTILPDYLKEGGEEPSQEARGES